MRNERTEKFEEFVREYGERAFQFAYSLCGDIEEAKEVVQEAFCRALKKWDSYDQSRPLEAWFFVVLRNVFIDGRRRYGPGRLESLDRVVGEFGLRSADLLPDEEAGVIERLERTESARLVRETLLSLPVDQRAVLSLRELEGLTYEEIGEVLGVPPGTVRSRISRARIGFRKLVVSRGLEVSV